MDETRLFTSLGKEDKAVLIKLLRSAFRTMDTEQRRSVFSSLEEKDPPPSVRGKELFKKVNAFHRDSRAGKFYAAFDMNSKNFMHVPEETREWFETLGDLLENSTRLAKQGNHTAAVQCFSLLYELIKAVDSGDDEIVFADELGSWMIPGDTKKFARAYLSALAKTSTPEEFTKAALPLIRDDSSGVRQVYASAIRVANKEQKAFLNTEIERQHIKTGSPVV